MAEVCTLVPPPDTAQLAPGFGTYFAHHNDIGSAAAASLIAGSVPLPLR